ncbi:helix-turn-helix domain-containing protein [Bradyrhizobium liaoningense]|uniref:helix-turn-helix domain-containing protein n=1 Tax=Bradyrhizobium liaoningense TaxID=43992 RepID=UPI001BAE2D9B|nr:helix-turn-helix domain-containing protein [Bradyrhizobium liaoningense]MBR0713680.1 helix-turn-helix domain-containing protein [Bradyrhizobium liaoningense]
MQIWNTEELPDRDQFAYWREVLCEAFVTLRPERPGAQGAARFPSRVTAYPLSTINVTTVQSKAHHVIRGDAEIRRASQEVYFVNLQLSGRCRYETEGRETIVGPNQFAVVDSTRPYFLDFMDDWNVFSFRIPRHMLRPLLQKPDCSTGICVSDKHALGEITVGFLKSIAMQRGDLPAQAVETLAGDLVNLTALALGATEEARMGQPQSVRRGLFSAIMKFVETNLADPQLAASSVAAHFGISVRYLHRVFEESDKSFGQVVLERRLVRCAGDLEASDQSRISDVAFRWGFRDISHFNRSFRQRFGFSPREYRSRQ